MLYGKTCLPYRVLGKRRLNDGYRKRKYCLRHLVRLMVKLLYADEWKVYRTSIAIRQRMSFFVQNTLYADVAGESKALLSSVVVE